MSVTRSVTLVCDCKEGQPGSPCPVRYPSNHPLSQAARAEARAFGWTNEPVPDHSILTATSWRYDYAPGHAPGAKP